MFSCSVRLHFPLLAILVSGTLTARQIAAQQPASIAPSQVPMANPTLSLAHERSKIPLVTARQGEQAGQVLLVLPRSSLGADFQVKATSQERLIGGSLTKDSKSEGQGTPMRWMLAGDSVILLQYQAQGATYVRRGAYPVLHATADTLLFDATGLFGVTPGTTLVDGVPNPEYAPKGPPPALTLQQVDAKTNEDYTIVRVVYQTEAGRIHQVTSDWTFERLRLPQKLMLPRLKDPHVTYWATEEIAGKGARAGKPISFIERWRLDKKDPTAAVSDVVRPIVYRIDSTVPRKWVPWIRRGIQAWIPAFEAIGFRHAIVVQDGGAPAKLPDGSDAPECVVSWVHEYQGGAETSPDVFDSRSGEILHAWMHLNNGTIGLAQDYSFLYLGGLDPHVRYPFADSVSGFLLQMMVTHEAGHSLGFDHNFQAGTMYPTDSLHSAAFLRRMGVSPSIMSYTFYDAVAQPEDHIPPQWLWGRIGPYDLWALGWGYRPIATAKTPEDELPTLERWRAVQDTSPYLYAGPGGSYRIGADPLKSAEGISRNLARTVPTIDAQRDTGSTGMPSLAEALRGDALQLWGVSLNHAIDLIGGTRQRLPQDHAPEQVRIVPVDSAQQVNALRFVLAHVLYGQDALVQALFNRSRADTTLMLFNSAPAGWASEQWQGMQRQLFALLVYQSAGLSAQAQTTHVLPVFCSELQVLEQKLDQFVALVPRPEDGKQAEMLQENLKPLFDPSRGACRPQGAPAH